MGIDFFVLDTSPNRAYIDPIVLKTPQIRKIMGKRDNGKNQSHTGRGKEGLVPSPIDPRDLVTTKVAEAQEKSLKRKRDKK